MTGDSKKRFQVFVSSTYRDLVDEREAIFKMIRDLDHMPAGMEAFPATDTEQFEYIKRILDETDYYIIVVAGRYGSISEQGLSFTEREYDYAVGLGIPILTFLHKNPDKIDRDKTETDPAIYAQLESFRAKLARGRLVRPWDGSTDLAAQVGVSLTRAIADHPRVGWVRATGPSRQSVLEEINELRKANEELRSQFSASNAKEKDSGVDPDKLHVALSKSVGVRYRKRKADGNWGKDTERQISLRELCKELSIDDAVESSLIEDAAKWALSRSLNAEIDTIQVIHGQREKLVRFAWDSKLISLQTSFRKIDVTPGPWFHLLVLIANSD